MTSNPPNPAPGSTPIYSGDEDHRLPDPDGTPLRTEGQSAEQNRGQRAPKSGSGVVIGSGASDGGGGSAEDIATDPESGSAPID